ncbi:CapA family protein [Oricola sp.]|uniref:CapA family protein n=1 Tax=Oricola sp. TaxID=1979950 RepID=UPI0025E2505B|nr:CapA family protein [Oricola sp.]MCI5078112.1 CapA family protein [Oricola sp.]
MSLRFVAVGDVAPDREDPATIFDHVRDRLTAADLGYCQLEVNLTDRGERLPQARHTMRGKPEIADALVGAGLEIVSFAGNHTMDWGVTGMVDTLAHLDRAGALQVGAGMDIEAARSPVVVERNGVRVGFLSVNSILPQNYWADEDKPGCAPMRGHTVYEQIEHDQPGTPARIHTFPHKEDIAALIASIRAVRDRVDFLVLGHHAGIHFVPAVVPDYQRDVAHAAIDAGVDMVLGCHAHILKGVEFYRGKPIIHSLANFALDLKMTEAHAKSKGFREIQKLNPDWIPDLTSSYNFPPDSAMSFAVEAEIDGDRLVDLALVPVFIERDANPRFVAPDDPRFDRILSYLRTITAQAGFSTDYQADGDVIRPGPRA